MNIDLDMFSASVMNWILQEVDGNDVAVIHDTCFVDDDMQLPKKLTQPAAFRGGVGDSMILGLGA
jgi:hypothetical protein